jgi:thioredoxin 1
MTIKNITEENFETEILKASGRVLVDFNATWCGPCQMVGIILEELSDEFNIASVDVDESPNLATAYQVSTIPCLILFEDGKEIKRNVGVQSEKFLKKWLSK